MVNSVYTSGFKHPCSAGVKRKRRHAVEKVSVRQFSVAITTGVLFPFMNIFGLKSFRRLNTRCKVIVCNELHWAKQLYVMNYFPKIPSNCNCNVIEQMSM